jgi:acyl dehydratase
MAGTASLRVGADLPPLARTVARADVKAYADASGDQNPLHQDDEFARSVGFPGVIAHGMFTMGHLTSSVARWVGPGASIRRMRAQFRSAVLLGDTIVAGGLVRAIDEEAREATLELWVSVERVGTVEYPIKRAEALVSLAGGDEADARA